MNTQQQSEAIRAACVNANPEIDKDWVVSTIITSTGEEHIGKKVWRAKAFRGRPIRLADILLAINEMNPSPAEKLYGGVYPDMALVSDVVLHWDCAHDNLSLQSPETISFLYELLQSPTPSENKT